MSKMLYRKYITEQNDIKHSNEQLYSCLYDGLYECIKWFPYGFEKKIRNAVKAGFPIDFTDDVGETLLFAAIFSAEAINIGIHKMLLKLGASPNVANKYGTTLLNEAIYWLCPAECLNTLIDAGADVNGKNVNGIITPFSLAANHFIYGKDENRQEYGRTIVKLLIDNGADPYLCDCWLFHRDSDFMLNYIRRRELEKYIAQITKNTAQ